MRASPPDVDLEVERQLVTRLVYGQDGWYDVRVHRDEPQYWVGANKLVRLVGKASYFSPIPRRHRRGTTAADVLAVARLCWVDVDDPDALDALPNLRGAGAEPSAVVHSGAGYWFYWRMSAPTPVARIVEANKALGGLLIELSYGVDKASVNANRNARLPGAVHEATGATARFVEGGWEDYDVDRLIALAPAWGDHEPSHHPRPTQRSRSAAGVLGRFHWYLKDGFDVDALHAQGKKRFSIELAIVRNLCAVGCSDDRIRDIFDEVKPHKHQERKRANPGNPYGYLNLLLHYAR